MALRKTIALAAALIGVAAMTARSADAQFQKKWLSGGSLHNWYSEVGSEVESGGFVGNQQDGARWPGVYRFTDVQAWKGVWIGATNVTDEFGDRYDYRVVHAGPRVSGSGEFFPLEFELAARQPVADVFVDGFLSESLAPMVVDRVDPDLPSDFVLYTRVNTLLGVTMERTVYQFSQEYHDNYHVIEYVLTNTGNTDGDGAIELPDQTLEGVYFFKQWRWAPTRETRYVIGNATGWGINTMVDTWGDGDQDNLPSAGEQVRAQYAWHGFFPNKDVSYDNLGGPILPSALPADNVADTDTLGRLGAYQFVGAVTLHADASASDPSDDSAQPSTTTAISSDAPFQSQNDAFNPPKMQTEYNIMSSGHALPSHAYVVEPSGMPGWLSPSGDPSLGTPGGFSAANGYGPYTLGPGESVRIVMADAVDGLSREASRMIGRQYKLSDANESALLDYPVDGQVVSQTKNEWALSGRDSLYHTFLRARDNFESGFGIPPAPPAPTAFNVNSGGDRISLSWEYPAAPPDGFEVYRAPNAHDSTYTLIHSAGPSEQSYEDTTPTRGIDYYYYVVAVQNNNSDGTGRTPTNVPLKSSRYATQTYVPANLKRQPGEALSDIRIVPNPFNLGSSSDVRWPDQTDKLGFLNIPGQATIEIYTELGELVDTIVHDDGSGDAFWDHTTSSRQLVASGLYFAVITDTETGGRIIKKLVIIR